MPQDTTRAKGRTTYHATPAEAYHTADPLPADFGIVSTQPAANPDFEVPPVTIVLRGTAYLSDAASPPARVE